VLVELSVMEQRYRAVPEVTQARIPVTELAARYGVSRQTLHAWIKRYEAEGIGGLIDRSRRPEHIPVHIDPEVEAAICEMRRQHPDHARLLAGQAWGVPAPVAHHDLAGPGAQQPRSADRPQTSAGQLRPLGA
jgi:transposase-like protein